MKVESTGEIWGSGSAHSSIENVEVLTANLMNNGKKKIRNKRRCHGVTKIKRIVQDGGQTEQWHSYSALFS